MAVAAALRGPASLRHSSRLPHASRGPCRSPMPAREIRQCHRTWGGWHVGADSAPDPWVSRRVRAQGQVVGVVAEPARAALGRDKAPDLRPNVLCTW